MVHSDEGGNSADAARSAGRSSTPPGFFASLVRRHTSRYRWGWFQKICPGALVGLPPAPRATGAGTKGNQNFLLVLCREEGGILHFPFEVRCCSLPIILSGVLESAGVSVSRIRRSSENCRRVPAPGL